MTLKQNLQDELRREAPVTRRVLERLPDEQLGWRPHPRSMSLGQLALHIAGLPIGIGRLLEHRTAEVPTVPLPEPASRAEILTLFDDGVAFVNALLAAWDDDTLADEWTLTLNGKPLISTPRGEVVRSLILNHTYHHRGQVTVYLRLLEVPLPDVYGPTADEPFPFEVDKAAD